MSERRGTYRMQVRRVSDGVVSVSEMAHHHGGTCDFIWTEGNFSCDCNRGSFFAEGRGEPDPDAPCGDDQYVYDWIELDGVRFVEHGKATDASSCD